MPYSDPTNAMRLYEAASAAIQAADLEYEVDEVGSHHLLSVHVPVNDWLALHRATSAFEAKRGLAISAKTDVVVTPPVEDPFRRKEEA